MGKPGQVSQFGQVVQANEVGRVSQVEVCGPDGRVGEARQLGQSASPATRLDPKEALARRAGKKNWLIYRSPKQ